MKLTIDKEWFKKRAAQEGDLEISTGRRRTMTLNLTDDEIDELETLAFEGLPEWARHQIKTLTEAVVLADAIRSAQKAYMLDRGNESLGKAVGRACQAYDEYRSTIKMREGSK